MSVFCPKLNLPKMPKLNLKTPKLNLKILKLNLETVKLKKIGNFMQVTKINSIPSIIIVQPAENPLKTKFSNMSVMKSQFKNEKCQLEHAKIPYENPKTQFETAKTQYENAKTQKPRKYLRKFSLIDAQKKALHCFQAVPSFPALFSRTPM